MGVPMRPRPALTGASILALSLAGLLVPALGSPTYSDPVNTFAAYDVGSNGGEPSIGWDTKRGVAMYTGSLTETRLSWDDTTAPATMTTKVVNPPTNRTSFDPIGVVDPDTGRTFVSQLLLACSAMSYSDNAGDSWQVTEGCGPGALLDHQTVGVARYHAPVPPRRDSSYPNAVYYCAQNGYSGACARSDDGGLTFANAVPVTNTPANNNGDPTGGACSALHGHLHGGPDGTVYLPLKGCGGQPTAENLTNTEYWGGHPSLSVSEDNGLTWQIRQVQEGHNQDESDPSLGIATDGTLYFGWQDGENPSATGYGTTSTAKIAVSHDHGKTWENLTDIGAMVGVKNVQFPEVIAGDPNRAAFAFLGTDVEGDDQHNGFVDANGMPAVWKMYVAMTYDGGEHWVVVDAMPTDPVQRGCVDMQGTSNKNAMDGKICNQRNMLDFNDITVDTQGRVLVAYSDGCTGGCVDDAAHTYKNNDDYVLRQQTGKGLYAAHDGEFSGVVAHPVPPPRCHPEAVRRCPPGSG